MPHRKWGEYNNYSILSFGNIVFIAIPIPVIIAAKLVIKTTIGTSFNNL